MVERYVAGPGDAACVSGGLGCARFFLEGAETSVHVVVTDDVMRRVAFNICGPECDVNTGPLCASGEIAGLSPGDQIAVFLHLRPSACGLVSAPVKGTITATFR